MAVSRSAQTEGVAVRALSSMVVVVIGRFKVATVLLFY